MAAGAGCAAWPAGWGAGAVCCPAGRAAGCAVCPGEAGGGVAAVRGTGTGCTTAPGCWAGVVCTGVDSAFRAVVVACVSARERSLID